MEQESKLPKVEFFLDLTELEKTEEGRKALQVLREREEELELLKQRAIEIVEKMRKQGNQEK